MKIENRISRADYSHFHERAQGDFRRKPDQSDAEEVGEQIKRSTQTVPEECSRQPFQSMHRARNNADRETKLRFPARSRRALATEPGLDAVTHTGVYSSTPVPVRVAEARRGSQIFPLPQSEFAASDAYSALNNQVIVEDIDVVGASGKELDKVRYFYQILENKGEGISRRKLIPLEEFNEKVRKKCPDI